MNAGAVSPIMREAFWWRNIDFRSSCIQGVLGRCMNGDKTDPPQENPYYPLCVLPIHRSSIYLQFPKQHQKGIDDFYGSLFFHFFRGNPGFISTEFVLSGSGQIAIGSVGKFDRKGVSEWTFVFDFKAGFCEHLERNG